MSHRVAAFIFALFAFPALGAWSRVADGVDYERIVRDSLDVHVTRIDLRNPNVRIIASEAGDRGLTVSELAKKRSAIVAINADYFDEQLRPAGFAAGVCGAWTRGTVRTRRQPILALGFGRAQIVAATMPPRRVRRWLRGAVSGWPLLVSGCKPIASLPGSDRFTRAPHPRTAVGLSKDRKTMFLVVADGRRADVVGMTLPQLALFFVDELGVCSALNLDGGGSSAMSVGGTIVNRPSDGVERKVGNHLAVVTPSSYSVCPEAKKRQRTER